MRKISILGTAAIFLALGGIEAKADNPYVHSPSRHAIMGHQAAPRAKARRFTTRGPANWRAEYKDVQPDAPWNGYVDYKSVGLSDNPEDCNRGCAVSNGG